MNGKQPYVLETELHGKVVCEWIDNGAFIIQHSEIDHPEFPDGVSIIGSDDAAKNFFMLYLDQRTISRKYDVIIDKKQIIWSREDPHFSQRMTMTIEDEGNKIISYGEMRKEGGIWEKDLSLIYTRVKK